MDLDLRHGTIEKGRGEDCTGPGRTCRVIQCRDTPDQSPIATPMAEKPRGGARKRSAGSPAGEAGTRVPSTSRTGQGAGRIIGRRPGQALCTAVAKRRRDGFDGSRRNHGMRRSRSVRTDDGWRWRRRRSEEDGRKRDATGRGGGMTSGGMVRSGGSGRGDMGDGEG